MSKTKRDKKQTGPYLIKKNITKKKGVNFIPGLKKQPGFHRDLNLISYAVGILPFAMIRKIDK